MACSDITIFLESHTHMKIILFTHININLNSKGPEQTKYIKEAYLDYHYY